MRKTRKMNVVIAMVLSMTLLFGATISANAADVTVSFEVQKTDVNLDMTVPSELQLYSTMMERTPIQQTGELPIIARLQEFILNQYI